MKPYISFILMLFAMFGISACGKKTIHIVYNTTISSDAPQMGRLESMIESSKMELFVNNKFCRVNSSSYGGTYSIIIDRTSQQAIALTTRDRAAAKTNINELKKERARENEYTVTLTDSVKKIAGYTCKKAIVTTKEGHETIEHDVWYTTDLDLGDLSGTPLGYDKIPGTPIEICMRYGPLKVKWTASIIDLNAAVDSNTFDMTIPKGYELLPLHVLRNIGSGN